MGLFDLFKGKGKESGGAEKKPGPAAKWAEAAGSKRAQAYDRQEAIHELCKLKTPAAVEALLKRFTFTTDPSITDQEEKDAAFEGIVATGRDAVEPVRTFVANAKPDESLSAPIRILKELMTEEELVEELISWLSKWDTDYAKFIDPKLQLLEALEDYKSPEILKAVEPFLQDFTEPARYRAVMATLAQDDPVAVGPLVATFLEEESVRIKNKLAEALAEKGWSIPEEQREPLRKVLPYSFSIDGAGVLTKRG